MTVRETAARRQIAVRKGTGQREAGQASARRIVEAANALLSKSGQAQFSMRNVAAEAGLRLANVQYYFPTRDALIDALFQDIAQRYEAAYRECLDSVADDRAARFEAILRFNLQDLGQRATRRYFIQLWALLDSLDGDTGRRLKKLYELDIAQLSERITEIDPKAAPAEIRRRATLLAALIEGLMVVCGAHSADRTENEALFERARDLGFAIALGKI